MSTGPGPLWQLLAQRLERPELATANRAWRRRAVRFRRGHKLAGKRSVW